MSSTNEEAVKYNVHVSWLNGIFYTFCLIVKVGDIVLYFGELIEILLLPSLSSVTFYGYTHEVNQLSGIYLSQM